MAGEEDAVRAALEAPDEVRQSRADPTVYLFYSVQQAKRKALGLRGRKTERW